MFRRILVAAVLALAVFWSASAKADPRSTMSGYRAMVNIWYNMTQAEKPDTALSVDQIVYPEDLGQWEPILGQVGVTLTTGTPYPTNGWDAREAVLDGLYCTWSANFTDSIAVILRGGISMDASTHAGMDLDLRTDATCDSIVTYLEDNGGTGGYAYIPLTDRDGQYPWAPFKSFSFNKVGTGNVTGFKAYYVWRRLR